MSAGIALGGSAIIAGVGFAAVTYGGALASRVKGAPSAGAPIPRPKASSVVPMLVGSANAGTRVTDSSPPRRKPKTPPRPVAGAEPDRALVRIIVNGPQNALVSMDGVKLDWFGPPREITVGSHTFDFEPPNPDCCEAGQKLTVEIRPPSTPGEIQLVQGRIKFKNAVLELSGPAGSSASCGELGTFPVPSRQSFPMTVAQKRARCTLLPPAGSPAPPKGFDVTLSPGGVFRLPGP